MNTDPKPGTKDVAGPVETRTLSRDSGRLDPSRPAEVAISRAPDTTLSAEDAAHLETVSRFFAQYLDGAGKSALEVCRIIRYLDAKLVAARKEELRLIECCKNINRERNDLNDSSFMNYDRFVKSEAEIATLTERLRVAEERNHIISIERLRDIARCQPEGGVLSAAWLASYIDTMLADPPTCDAAPKDATDVR